MNKNINLYRKSKYDYSIEKRTVELAEYLVQNKCTVRQIASIFKISKTIVHKDLSERLKKINPQLWKEANKVLQFNKRERYKRGAIAKKMKYSKK